MLVTGFANDCASCRMREPVTTTSSMGTSFVAGGDCASWARTGAALNAPAAPRKRKDRKDVCFVALMTRSLIVKPEDVGKSGASQSTVNRNDRRALDGLVPREIS